MARKTETWVATEGRDKGKHFVITEMSAARAEKWATRALLAIGRAGVDLPDDLASAGMAALAYAGLKAITSCAFEDAEPLLDEMMQCVTIQPDPKLEFTRGTIEDDFEEVATLVQLRDRVFGLHVGFSIAAELAKLGAAAKKALDASNDTQTSPLTSGS
jgi:hypothetical protein